MFKFSDLLMMLAIGCLYWFAPSLFVSLMSTWAIPGVVVVYLFFSTLDENREGIPHQYFRHVLKVPYLLKYTCAIIRGNVYQRLQFPPATDKGINVVFDEVNLISGFESYLAGADPWLVFVDNSKAVFLDITAAKPQ